jgi:hypothetical protein
MVRMIAILSAMGLVGALVFGFGDRASVQVMLFGYGLPTYDASNFEDCGPTEWHDDFYAYLRGSGETPKCDYTLGFRAGKAPVTRLRVKLALMRDGKVIGRDSIQIGSLDRPADDPYVTKTIRGECNAKAVRILEARANIAGQDTDLIASGGISSKGVMPFMSDAFIKIGAAES